MQSGKISLISQVIPRMDDLVDCIDAVKDNSALHPAIRSAAWQGLEIMNKYYSLTDDSWVYRIAMGTYLNFAHCIDI